MKSKAGYGSYGVPHDTKILTAANGWMPLDQVPLGTRLVHPQGRPSRLSAVIPLGERDLYRVNLVDGTHFTCTEDQVIRIRLGAGTKAPLHDLSLLLIHDAILRGRPIRLPRDTAYTFGTPRRHQVPPYLMGLLLGDGYLRRSAVTLCNEQPQVHELAAAALPPGTRLAEIKVGQAGTGSADIVGVVPEPTRSCPRCVSSAWPRSGPGRSSSRSSTCRRHCRSVAPCCKV